MAEPDTHAALEQACAQEIAALHAAFQAWLGLPAGGQMTRFDAAFEPGFHLITPEGKLLDRAAVLEFLSAGCGTRGRDFRIEVEDVRLLHAAPPFALMHYIERQWLFGDETARRSTALMRLGPEGPRWLHVQETRIARGR